MSEGSCRQNLRLVTLPDEILLGLFQHLPLKASVTVLPLVCRSFARLLRLPNPRLGGQEFSLLIAQLKTADGHAICKWLPSRMTQRDSFSFPADALRLQYNEGCIPELLELLPISLQQLTLQSTWFDGHHPPFQRSQDLAPHLSVLARLSQLQKLAVPIHATLDRPGLAALSQVQHLHLHFRCCPEHQNREHVMPGVSLSVLSSLASLSMMGTRVRHIEGAAALASLTQLDIRESTSLSLAGARHCTALRSLRLCRVDIRQSGSEILLILQSMRALHSLHLDEVTFDDSSLLEIAALINLAGLQELEISQCDGLSFDKQLSNTSAVCALTNLAFWWLPSDEGLEIPSLSHLGALKTLCLMPGNSCFPFVIPCQISAMQSLSFLDVVAAEPGNGCVQTIDISALALLGPSIESIWIMGAVRVRSTCSLLSLAAQPNLKEFRLGSQRQCFMSSEDESWLFCSALCRELSDRPQKNLSALSVYPRLGKL